MTNTWPMVTLGEVLIHYKEYIDEPEPKVYPKLSVKLYGKGVVLDEPADGSSLKMKRHQVAKSGQVILSEIWGKKGAIGFVPPEGNGALCTSHFFLFNVNHNKIDPKYLQAIFTANYLQEQLDAEAKGTTGYAAVRPKNLLAATIPLPPLPEQRRIVARIAELAAKIEEARGLRRLAVEEAASLVSSLHLNLAETRVVRLGDVLVLDELQEEVQLGKEYPQVGVKGFGQGLFARETLDASQTTYKRFNRLYDGAVVLSQVKGWEGAIAVSRPNLAGRYVSPEYRTFRCIQGMAIPEYLAALFAVPWFWSQLKNLTRGVGGRRERIRPEFFLEIKLPMPTVEQQQQAILVFEKVDAIKRLQAETSAELEALLPSVLDWAFKGELGRRMYKAVNIRDGTSIVILDPRWANAIDYLRSLDAQDILVCQRCKQPMRVRAGQVKRRHFAHKHLQNCPYGHESPALLEARAVLYEWLVGQFGTQVVIEKTVEGIDLARPIDCWVERGTESLAYWIIDTRLEPGDREGIRSGLNRLHVTVNWVFTTSMLREDENKAECIHLTTTEREFMQHTVYDEPVSGSLYGTSLHYLDADQRTLTTWRDLHLIHAPQLFQGRRFRHAISEILVMPQNGEFVHPGESERLHEYRQRQAEVERRRRQAEQVQAQRQRLWPPSIADRPARGPQEPQQIREVVKPGWMALLETQTKPSGELEQRASHQEAVCEICGNKTTDWWYFDGKTGRCRCRTCRDQGKC